MTLELDPGDDYYALLNSNKSATFEELKQNYQYLIRKYHPDKCSGSQEMFLSVDKAWKILRDANLRREYDVYLQNMMDIKNVIVYKTLRKSELFFNDDNVAVYDCRCGSNFDITKDQIIDVEDQCLIECNDCSNCILIIE